VLQIEQTHRRLSQEVSLMVLPPWLARFNRRVTNRLTRRFADRLPGFAILIHRGRRSGQTYCTPVNAFRDGDDYIIALTYGPGTDWVRNVLAAGGCEMVTRSRRISLTNPRIVTESSRRWAPQPVRFFLGGIAQYMRLTRVPTPIPTDVSVAAPDFSPGADDAPPAQSSPSEDAAMRR
jgi:deazaflavin-dependent oxidoreductase (nitroreductase family)